MVSTDFTDLPWKEVKQLVSETPNLEKVKKIQKETFRIAADKSNREKVIESALKYLKKTNPDTNYEQAASLADMMQIFARMLIEQEDSR